MVSENGGGDVRYVRRGDWLLRCEDGFAREQFNMATPQGILAAFSKQSDDYSAALKDCAAAHADYCDTLSEYSATVERTLARCRERWAREDAEDRQRRAERKAEPESPYFYAIPIVFGLWALVMALLSPLWW